jgi:hypothetical protein
MRGGVSSRLVRQWLSSSPTPHLKSSFLGSVCLCGALGRLGGGGGGCFASRRHRRSRGRRGADTWLVIVSYLTVDGKTSLKVFLGGVKPGEAGQSAGLIGLSVLPHSHRTKGAPLGGAKGGG